MDNRTILLIDDDETLAELLAEHIQANGFRVIVSNDGSEGLKQAQIEQPELVVLDVMMPGLTGWEVCKKLRAFSEVPIIMLTAKGEEIDKLHGFYLGVDDYVTKPFSFAELTARIEAVLTRGRRIEDDDQKFISGDLTIDIDQRRVTLADEIIELSPTEYRVLEALSKRPKRTVPSEQILEEVWGLSYAGEVDHVKRYIWALRKKLEDDPGNPMHILTERGFGYRLE